ncbi:hypothetical protein EST38_g13856 [Candolleomyces aberdarensis]|uniref:Uncharacterized protein n=1 Tax=Candolleomyces aberdarensis TaxID=2316362 RepID=A0A4V1Q1L4_9AGAR|nr:hypothetical protein EST38_g13856 [Candolleomyces aberdarensis]
MLDFFHRVDTNPSCTFELMIDTEWGDSSTLKTLSRAVSDRAKRLRVDEGRGTIADISCDIEGYLVFELHSRPQDTTAENEPDFRLAIDAPKAQWIDQLTRAYMPILLIQSSHALQYILSNDPDITRLRLALTDNLNFNRSFFSLLFQISETHFVMKNVTDLTVHNVHIYFFNDLLVSRTPLFPALEILRITGTGTTDLSTGNAQSELIRQLVSSQKSRTLDTVDIRGLDPESALYASLANAAKFGILGANLLISD